MVGGVLADREEDAGGAFFRERLQYRGRVHRPRAVVKGQHHFLVAQEVEFLEMFEAEAGTARGVDLDRAADRRARSDCCRAGGSRLGRWAAGAGQARARRLRGAAGAGPWRGATLRPRCRLDANSETLRPAATICPACNPHLAFLKSDPASGRGVAVARLSLCPTHSSLVGAAAPTQRLRLRPADLMVGRS